MDGYIPERVAGKVTNLLRPRLSFTVTSQLLQSRTAFFMAEMEVAVFIMKLLLPKIIKIIYKEVARAAMPPAPPRLNKEHKKAAPAQKCGRGLPCMICLQGDSTIYDQNRSSSSSSSSSSKSSSSNSSSARSERSSSKSSGSDSSSSSSSSANSSSSSSSSKVRSSISSSR